MDEKKTSLPKIRRARQQALTENPAEVKIKDRHSPVSVTTIEDELVSNSGSNLPKLDRARRYSMTEQPIKQNNFEKFKKEYTTYVDTKPPQEDQKKKGILPPIPPKAR